MLAEHGAIMSNHKLPRRRIYLVRHAEVAYFDSDGKPLDPRQVRLTENGLTQAYALAQAMNQVPLDLAICSGMPRTEETALAILQTHDVSLRSDSRLREIRAGRLREVPDESREQMIAYAYDGAEQPGASFIGGETWVDFAERVGQAFDDLIANHRWLNLLIVAHDAVNRVLLCRILGNGLSGLKAIEQDPACLNIIEADIQEACIQRAYVRTLNLTPYDLVRTEQQLTVMEKVLLEFRP